MNSHFYVSLGCAFASLILAGIFTIAPESNPVAICLGFAFGSALISGVRYLARR